MTARLSLLVCLLLVHAARAPAAPEMKIRSGINREILDTSLDTGDTKIVLNNIIETGFFGRVRHESSVFENTEEMMEAVKQGAVDVFAMTTLPYFQNSETEMEPGLVLFKNGSSTVSYVLLANTEKSKGKSLADFRGARISTVENGVMDLTLCWLDVELSEGGLPLHGDFFRELTVHEKVNKAAMPVYFGKADLCLITESHWRVLSLLNPQMKTRLRVVAKSPGLLEGLLLFRKGIDPAVRAEAEKALLDLRNSEKGAQVMRLGKIDKIVRFDPQDLVASKAVYEKALRLRRSTGSGPPPGQATGGVAKGTTEEG